MLSKKEVIRGSSEAKELMQQIYDLRLETYEKLGWIPYSKKDSKLIKDEFDESPHTTHFAILEDGRVIGAHRATRYSEKDKLPLFKDGYTLDIFKTKNTSISELSRLVIRQDKKYPGCFFQLAHNMIKYTLDNSSELVCSIGIATHKDLFDHLGTKPVNDEMRFLIDKEGEKMLVINGVPVLADKSTLNYDIDLSKYKMERTFVVIKNG